MLTFTCRRLLQKHISQARKVGIIVKVEKENQGRTTPSTRLLTFYGCAEAL
jgi:hypothetical protein